MISTAALYLDMPPAAMLFSDHFFDNMPAFTPSAEAKPMRHHAWSNITLKNETSFPLILKSTQLEQGNFWKSPTSVQPFEAQDFSACTYQTGDILFGATGAVVFSLQIEDGSRTPVSIDLTIGFASCGMGDTICSATWGAQTTSAIDSLSADTSYTLSQGRKITLPDGSEFVMNFLISAIPGEEAIITIDQEFSE